MKIAPQSVNPEATLLRIDDLRVHFPVREGLFLRTRTWAKAVDGVSLEIAPGETLGLVGESGCGKTTLAKAIVQLIAPTSGNIYFQGHNLRDLPSTGPQNWRREIQYIFQDPAESLNARHPIGTILEEPYRIHHLGTRQDRQKWVGELLEKVGLPAKTIERYPFELSGGMRQRVGIARAIALKPKLILCDEPVSALDVSIQSQVLNLLLDLQSEMGLSYLFIAHDLTVVKHLSDRIAVMYLGKIVESAPAENIYLHPRHPYTQNLLRSIPQPDPHQRAGKALLQGDVPSPINPPSGCPFHPRCPHAKERCSSEAPLWRTPENMPEHHLSCHFDLPFEADS